MKKIGFLDTHTNKYIECGTWAKATLAVCKLAVSRNDYTRYITVCNGCPLDYIEEDECPIEYRARMIDMAIGYQLI